MGNEVKTVMNLTAANPMPRPVDVYFKNWSGPSRLEFRKDIKMNKFTGNQKWQMYCLERFPETRADDRELVKVLYDEFYSVWSEPFYMVMNRKDLPTFESIGRCRRKIQEENEDLRAEKPVEDRRLEAQIDFIEYAREDVRI